MNRLDPGAQRQEKLLSGTNSGAVFLSPGNRSFNALIFATQIPLSSGPALNSDE